MFAFTSLLVLWFVGCASAVNDWSKPCFSDVCEYDLLSTNGTSSGTLKIWGARGSISDITTAAGWEIIDCAPNSPLQDIRLVCKTNSSSSCANLYSGPSGAVGKVVRLPENCGKTAFAVVTKSYTPDDQSIPPNVTSSLVRRDGSGPKVQGLSLTTNWTSVGTPSTGPVNFAIRAANVPGAGGDIDTTPQKQRRRNSRIFRRGAVSDFVTGAVDDISSLNDFNVTQNTDLTPFDIDKTFNVFDQKISCPPVNAGVKIDVDAKAHAVASIGVAASGTVLPPAVSDFALIINLNAELDGNLLMNAQASGTLDSGKIPLFEVGIPGLDFPDILTIGPSFKIDAQATASLDVNLDLSIGVKYSIVNAQLVFPPNANDQNGGAFNIEDTPLLISASPDATATGTLEAHLIPSLNLGISALGDVVDASIFLELDASATMKLTANAEASGSTAVGRRSLVHAVPRQDPDAAPSESTSDTDDTATADGTTVDDANADGTTADDTGSADDTAPTDDAAPADDTTADDATADDTTADDTNADDTTADDTNADDTTADDTNADDTTANDTNADDTNADDTNADDTNADDTTADNTTADNTGSADDTAPTDDAAPAEDTTTADDTNTADDTSAATTDDTATATADDASGTTTDGTSTATTDNKSDTTVDPSSQSSGSASFSGCIEVDGALDVTAGATGSFFDLFDANTKVDLFNKEFEIFKNCFGGSTAPASRRRSLFGRSPYRTLRDERSWQRRVAGLTCPTRAATSGEALQTIVDQTISASSIQDL